MNYADAIKDLKKDAEADFFKPVYYAEKAAIKTLEYLQKQGIENLEALAEEMAHFDSLKRHETQYLDDMGDPLEPLKISSALESEILKYEHRKKHDPKSISILDYTIIAALTEALEKRTEQ